MRKEFSISVIIPNYNGSELLAKNLPDVLRAIKYIGQYEVIVVDDASDDNSVDLLNKSFPEVKIIKNQINQGFARSVNNGLSESTKDLVFILNSDISVRDDYFKHLIPYFNDESTFGVMGVIKDEQSEKILEGAKYPLFKDLELRFRDITFSENYEGSWIPTLYLCGGNALIDRKKIMTLNGFPLIYEPFYNEDLDLSLRAWMNGWNSYFEPRSVCFHRHSSTIRKYFEENYIGRISRRNRLILNSIYLSEKRKKRFVFKTRLKYFLLKILNIFSIPSSYPGYADFYLRNSLSIEKDHHFNDQQLIKLENTIFNIRKEIERIRET